MNNQNKIVLIISLFIGINLVAQNNLLYEPTFRDYGSYLSNKYGVKCLMPNNFIDLNKYYEPWLVRKNTHAGYLYGPILQSKNEECIIMYPYEPNNYVEEDLKIFNAKKYPRSQIIFELGAAYDLLDIGGFSTKDTSSLDFNKHVTIVGGMKAREMFNVDSIFFYNIPLEHPYKNKYTYCTGMVIQKQKRATMVFKWFFTNKGKIKEYEYINHFSKVVWYDEMKSNEQ